MIGRLRKLVSGRRDWVEVERFDPAWRVRISQMARHIGQGEGTVADLGCGPMWLKEYLPPGVGYIGVDYRDRGPGCVVCNLDQESFPDLNAQVYFISGCLEYMSEPEAFVSSVARRARKCIVSYCGLDYFGKRRERLRRGWRNHLLNSELAALFVRYGMRQVSVELTASNNAVFVFVRGDDKSLVVTP